MRGSGTRSPAKPQSFCNMQLCRSLLAAHPCLAECFVYSPIEQHIDSKVMHCPGFRRTVNWQPSLRLPEIPASDISQVFTDPCSSWRWRHMKSSLCPRNQHSFVSVLCEHLSGQELYFSTVFQYLIHFCTALVELKIKTYIPYHALCFLLFTTKQNLEFNKRLFWWIIKPPFTYSNWKKPILLFL